MMRRQIEQKENQDGKYIVRQPKTFAAEQKKKREEALTNPEMNRYVLLRVLLPKTEDVVKILKDNGTIQQSQNRISSNACHEAAQTQMCTMSKSDSLQCDVIRKARKKSISTHSN
ncbi:hypothetical protein RFI_05087 [Reticulomyxa filosa]|uniref:Uncharacterized protein n=1 Tax=Reticulomyxa filosa TaxID=46433 RepID=X6P1B2_RETFI|nr:hypothetical protein RFI_05087 [Reticulomyxa filosa]|eukprot:ETO32031.1 hypothetical protein RFI_05087 [Reticulomyxa filosa]